MLRDRMGRRRRRVIKVVKKKLPSVFVCPRCGEEAVRVQIPHGGGVAKIQCASCALKDEFQATAGTQQVDVYCWFTDKFYGAAIPKERIVTAQAPTSDTKIPTAIMPEASAEPLPTQVPSKIEESPEPSAAAKAAPPKSEEPSTVPDFELDEEELTEAEASEEEEAASEQPSEATEESKTE